MKKYKLINIDILDNKFYTTDATTIDRLADDLRKHIPSAEIAYRDSLPSGESYAGRIHKLKGQGIQTYWWTIKWLCEHGWEPIQEASSGGREMLFKKEIEE